MWNGVATNTQGTALIQTLNTYNSAIATQTLITCANAAANELVHCAWDPYPYIVLTWQTDATATNTAVVERYDISGTNRTHSATIVGKTDAEIYTTVPVCYVPATGSQPAKLLWATAFLGKREAATIQSLDFSLINCLIFVAFCAHPAEDGRLHILETAVPAVTRALCRDKYETVDNVTGTKDRYDYERKGQRIPVDFIYNETGPTHRLIWRTSP